MAAEGIKDIIKERAQMYDEERAQNYEEGAQEYEEIVPKYDEERAQNYEEGAREHEERVQEYDEELAKKYDEERAQKCDEERAQNYEDGAQKYEERVQKYAEERAQKYGEELAQKCDEERAQKDEEGAQRYEERVQKQDEERAQNYEEGAQKYEERVQKYDETAVEQDRTLKATSRKLVVHHSDASTCVPVGSQEAQEKASIEAASCADTEEWEPGIGRSHPRHPRRGRRAKARARREQWEDAKQRAFQESMGDARRYDKEGDSLVHDLLTCIAEDDEEGQVLEEQYMRLHGPDFDSDVCSEETLKVAPGVAGGASAASLDRATASLRARLDSDVDNPTCMESFAVSSFLFDGGYRVCDPCDSYKTSDNDTSSEGSANSAASRVMDLAGHELLEGLVNGAGLLPTGLVEAMVQLQLANCQERPDESLLSVRTTLDQTVTAFRSKLKRVRKVTRRLVATWNCPRDVAQVWTEMREWLLDDDDGMSGWCTTELARLQELVEEAEDRNLEDIGDKEWLEFELGWRHASLRMGWEQFEGFLDKLERVSARQVYRRQQQHNDAAHLQATLNARAAWSLGTRSQH